MEKPNIKFGIETNFSYLSFFLLVLFSVFLFTEAINLISETYSEKFLSKNDEIIISYLEHHANIVPWHIASKKYGFKVIAADITNRGEININDVIQKINNN